MNILFYTRLENDTGGDQALLYILYDAIRKNLPKDSKVKLILSVDTASMGRAMRIKDKWEEDFKKEFKNEKEDVVWIRENKNGQATICQTLSQNNKTLAGSNYSLEKYVQGDDRSKTPPIGLFVMAGWSHMQLESSAKFLKDTFKLKTNCKIFLCSSAGVDIVNQRPNGQNVNFAADLRKHKFNSVYTLQLGLEANAGYLLSKDFNSEMKAIVQSDAAKAQWVAHLKDNKVPQSHTPKDLIVIYCSKDLPGKEGKDFLNTCQKMPNQGVKPLVVLVGTDPTLNEKQWQAACKDTNFQCISISRTKDTVILMRGLLDAKRVLVTGAFTILEALYMGIYDCDYLYPSHLVRFQSELKGSRDPNKFIQAFERGQKTLSLLSAQVQKWTMDPFKGSSIQLPSPLPCFTEAGRNFDFEGYNSVASETKKEVVEVKPTEPTLAKLEVLTVATTATAKPEAKTALVAMPEATTAKVMEAKAEEVREELEGSVDVVGLAQKEQTATRSAHVTLSLLKGKKPKRNGVRNSTELESVVSVGATQAPMAVTS